jgi:regulator of cell morphogenesis and NO signaling
MAEVNATSTIGEWVTEHPRSARVFEKLQIDYCCGGGHTLAEACTEKGLELDALVSQLADSIANAPDAPQQSWSEASAFELCHHIEQTHHAYLRQELPRLSQLVAKVATAHAANHPELRELQRVFAALRAELEPHMAKEEQILFPAIRLLEQSTGNPQFPFGTVANPIGMMKHEHDNAGAALKRIRELTDGFQAPADACTTWQLMLNDLRQLEADMHKHVHKENNILFPKAQQLEASRR